MVSCIALAICVLIPTATLADVGTCDASDPSKCMSAAGPEKLSTQGNALLQSVHTKGRAQNVHEDMMGDERAAEVAAEPNSQVEANFVEMEKHAKALADRLEIVLENPYDDQPHLTPEAKEKVHDALDMLQQVHEQIKDVRSKHASFIQKSSTSSEESRGQIVESIQHIWNLAQDAEKVLAEVDGVDAGEDDEEALLQEGEEVEEEVEEEEEEGEEGEEEDEEGEEHDDEDDEEHEEEDDEEEHGEHEEHEDFSEMQKGEGVQYEPPEEEKSIERH